jgi:HemK-related putative methylase
MNTLTRRLALLGHRLRRPFLRRRLGRVVVEELDGLPLIVLPEVFNPVLFRTGTVLARAIASSPWAAPRAESPRALDLGTGSGAGAVFAARRGYRVTAVDLNPEAVRCARLNALLHRLEDRIDVREGDLFAPVPGETFDLILFNPPFFRGTPKSRFDLAWRGTDVLERFAAGLPAALAPGGVALLLLSTDGDGPALLAALEGQGLTSEPAVRRDFGNEVVTVWAVTTAPAAATATPPPPSRPAAHTHPAAGASAPGHGPAGSTPSPAPRRSAGRT